MKINISDMMDHWEGETPRLESVPVPEPDKLREMTLAKIRDNTPEKKRRRLAPALVIAAAVLACVAGVSAATGQLQAVLSLPWQNDTLVSSLEEVWEDAAAQQAETGGEEVSTCSVSSPNGTPPSPLSELLKTNQAKAMTWETEEHTGGSFGPVVEQWTDLAVINAAGPVKSRVVKGYGRHEGMLPKRYVKYEYTAQTPAELASAVSGLVTMDTGWLAETYQVPEWANFYYQIYDSRGTLRGEVWQALYTTTDERYVQITYEYAPDLNLSPSYMVESDYDRAETYTSATGLEAVITTSTGNLWAEAITPEFVLVLYGGYLTVEEAEAILDHITVNIVPET